MTLDILNLLGQEVKVLVDAAIPAGTHRIDWDGTDHQGKPAATGVYFYRLRTGQSEVTKKMLLLK